MKEKRLPIMLMLKLSLFYTFYFIITIRERIEYLRRKGFNSERKYTTWAEFVVEEKKQWLKR